MERRGISFTLTIVVAGVILLMTALSIITLGGSSIQNFFSTISGEQQEAVTQAGVREACNDLKVTINREYCNQYVKKDCTDPIPTRDPSPHNMTASERSCALSNWGGSYTVTVGGNTYSCMDQGYIADTVCPA